MLQITIAQNRRSRQDSPSVAAAKLCLERHVRARHDAWQAQLEARRLAEQQRFLEALQEIKAVHGQNWQRYAGKIETLIFGDPFAEDAVTVEFNETVTIVKWYGRAPNYFLASSARKLFSELNA